MSICEFIHKKELRITFDSMIDAHTQANSDKVQTKLCQGKSKRNWQNGEETKMKDIENGDVDSTDAPPVL